MWFGAGAGAGGCGGRYALLLVSCTQYVVGETTVS